MNPLFIRFYVTLIFVVRVVFADTAVACSAGVTVAAACNTEVTVAACSACATVGATVLMSCWLGCTYSVPEHIAYISSTDLIVELFQCYNDK